MSSSKVIWEGPKSKDNCPFKSEADVYLWPIHFDIWQNYYNYVKFKNKIKLKKKKKSEAERIPWTEEPDGL